MKEMHNLIFNIFQNQYFKRTVHEEQFRRQAGAHIVMFRGEEGFGRGVKAGDRLIPKGW